MVENLYHIAKKCNSTPKEIFYKIHNKEKYYFQFEVPKKSGSRVISAPAKRLKDIQKNLLKNVLYKKSFPHEYAHGFAKRKSILTNASIHKNRKIILKLDIKDFFPSISFNRVKNLFLYMGLSEYVSTAMADLVTYKNQLPQGAPTSPYITNLICKKLDTRLYRFAKKCGLKYSRYADDMSFSGNSISGSIIRKITKIIEEEGFVVNDEKTRVIGQGTAQIVTGMIVNKKVGIGRKKYLEIKALVHNCQKFGIASQNIYNHPKFKQYLLGKISLLKNLDIKKWEILKTKIDKLDWKNYSPIEINESAVSNSSQIISLMNSINILTNDKIFYDSNEKTRNLFMGCINRADFNERMQLLFRWINDMNSGYFQKNLSQPVIDQMRIQGNLRPIRIIEAYFKETGKNGTYVIDVWDEIKDLSSGLVRHGGKKLETRVAKILEKYSGKRKNIDYNLIWLRMIENFKISLAQLFELMNC